LPAFVRSAAVFIMQNYMEQQGLQLQFEVRDMRHKEKFQIDDIYLNGYAKKCGIYATGVYVSLCRHVDRNQKCFPSIRRIAEELNISEKQTGRAIKILENYNIIRKVRLGKKLTNRYYLLDRSEWTDSPISDKTHSPIPTDSQSVHQGTVSPIHSKDTHTKDTQEKGIATQSVADINPLIELFKEVNPSYERLFGNTTQRSAMERMLKKYGREKIEQIIKFLPKIFGKPYSPVITTPYLLEQKMANLIAYMQNQRSKKEGVLKI